MECTGLKQVMLSNSITSIGHGAFEDCASLKKITWPDSVPNILDYMFSGCTALTEITIPSSVTYIAYDKLDITDDFNPFYQCTNLKKSLLRKGPVQNSGPKEEGGQVVSE